MKSHRFMLFVGLMLLRTVAFAQSDAQKSSVAPAPSEAQKSFTTMKSLAGEWEGPVTVPEMPEISGGKPMHLSLRVTSRGNALVHEFQERRWMRRSTTTRSRCFTWTETNSR
jgi:hypothetical protein